MAEACEMRRFEEAEYLLTAAIDQTYIRYPNMDDPDIRRTLSIAQNYQNYLKKSNKRSDTWSDR
ncbi:MAG: hypothetical protein J2P31_02995 [Blastocatellia bacterium]|nr:hypothetical protein [Blastocatellia bacterium]